MHFVPAIHRVADTLALVPPEEVGFPPMRTHLAPPLPGWIIHTAVLGTLFTAAVLIAFRVI
jgi:hypothetical protein